MVWRRPSLRVQLLIAFLVVALAGTVALVVTAELASGAFYESHLVEMSGRYGGSTPDAMHEELRSGFTRTLGQSLLVGLAVGIPLALVAGWWVSRRLLEPVGQVSLAAKRIAAGAYSERLPAGDTDELGRLIEEFNRMASALEHVEARRVELIGTVAHELRTPLSGLQGYAEGLSDGLFEPGQAAEAIRREVARLRRVVEDLSEVSKLEAGAIKLHLEVFDLCELVRELHDRYRPMFEDVASNLQLELPDEPIPVWADRDRVAQVVINLFSNVLRHAPGSTVKLRAKRDGTAVQLEVADSGPGIAPEHLSHVFERFYRVDASRSRGSGGSGVGLTISRHLANAMRGRLEVESELGRGSRFVLVLPGA